MKYVYCRYESNLPLGPELTSQIGNPLGVKFCIRWVQIQTDISLSAVLRLDVSLNSLLFLYTKRMY